MDGDLPVRRLRAGWAPTASRSRAARCARRASGAQRYRLKSEPFTVSPLKIVPGTPSVSGGVASVRPLYPDPGAGALIALPRLVRDATVRLSLSDGRTVTASDADGDGLYTATVGSAAVRAVSVRDACDNT